MIFSITVEYRGLPPGEKVATISRDFSLTNNYVSLILINKVTFVMPSTHKRLDLLSPVARDGRVRKTAGSSEQATLILRQLAADVHPNKEEVVL